MSAPRLDFVTCASPAGLHRMAYWEWGAPDNDQVLLCVHGLSRTGRDFDAIARQLAGEFRVVCPDVVGRGASDWLANPAFYTVPQYAADMLVLLARLRAKHLHWLGTSMGGLIALAVAGGLSARAGTDNPALRALPALRFASLVLNDVGPRLAAEALARIGTYIAAPVALPSFEAAVQYVRSVSTSFGPHSDEEWVEFTRHVYVERDGLWVRHYDPRLALAFADPSVAVAGEPLLWQAWRALDCPALILRGAESDLLTPATLREMLAVQPRARAHEIAGVGHAPSLLPADQRQVVCDFLRKAAQDAANHSARVP